MIHVQPAQTDVLEDQNEISPQQLEIFQETQAALLKSRFVLRSALSPKKIAQLNAVANAKPDPITWLQRELSTSFQGENLVISYEGDEDRQEMKDIVNAVLEAYTKEVSGKENLLFEEFREAMAKLHKELLTELEEKINKYQTLSQELGGAESEITSSQLKLWVNEIAQIQGQIIGQKRSLVEISVNRALAEQESKSATAVEQMVAQELEKDPMIANFKAEEYNYTVQIRALKARSKRGALPQIKSLETSLAQLKRESNEYCRQTEAQIRESVKRAPNDFLARVMMEYKLRKANIESELAKLEARYEEKKEEIQQKGIRNSDLSILEAEIEQLQEIESEMDYKMRSYSIRSESAIKATLLLPATVTRYPIVFD